jgi:hypothetical protein
MHLSEPNLTGIPGRKTAGDKSFAAGFIAIENGNGSRSSHRNVIAIAIFSAVLLIPCCWQSRIQAADLSSHIYNAWLASRIHRRAAPGLWISSQSNNILFDQMLEWLLVRVGPDWAQRLAVAACVLVFAWGAILFIFNLQSLYPARRADATLGSNRWWIAAPCVAMLSYGFIFHMGFFNFYLSMGLGLLSLATFIPPGRSPYLRAVAAPLLILAWIAHPFPVLWGVATGAYIAFANRFASRRRAFILASALAALFVARSIVTHRYLYSWSPRQLFFISGADQLKLFDWKYDLPFAGLLSMQWILLRSLIRRSGLVTLVSGIPFQLWLLNAAAVFLIPDVVHLPAFQRSFGNITDRLSLTAALTMCALVAAAPASRFVKIGLVSVTVIFFGLFYADNLALNRLEDRLDAAVARLPAGQRALSSLPSRTLRALCFQHDLDRACIGQCFSYGNYEASSGQFRVRAAPGNGIVLDNAVDVDAVANGTYVVRPQDLPLSLVSRCSSSSLESNLVSVCVRSLHAGEPVGNTP